MKKWWQSKTVWVGVITALVSILVAIQGANVGLPDNVVGYIGILIAIINIILRFLTDQPLDRSLT